MSRKQKQLELATVASSVPQIIKKTEFEEASRMADRVLRLYRPVKKTSTSFKGVKKVTVPNQSLTLKEILRRFVRKETLAVGREGIYNDSLGDLEKMANADITEQMEVVEDLKARFKKRQEEEVSKKKAEAEQKAKADFDKAVQDAAVKLQQTDPGDPGSKKV